MRTIFMGLIAMVLATLSAPAAAQNTMYANVGFTKVVAIPISAGPTLGAPSELHDYGGFAAVEQIAYDGKNGRLFTYASFQGPSGSEFNGIDRMNTNGSNFTPLVNLGTSLFVTALIYNPVDDKIYYATQDGSGVQTILRADAADGGNTETLYQDSTNTLTIRGFAIDVDGQILHWSRNEFSSTQVGELLSAPIPAPASMLSPTVLRTGLNRTIQNIDLTFSPAETFWAGDGLVRKASTDGSGSVTSLASNGVSGLVVDRANGHVYWTRPVNDQIHFADLDGANPGFATIADLGEPLAIDNPDLPVTLQSFTID